MAQHYSTRDFFRQMPNDLLARYFKRRDVLDHLNFTRDTEPDELFAACLALPDDKRKGMDALPNLVLRSRDHHALPQRLRRRCYRSPPSPLLPAPTR